MIITTSIGNVYSYLQQTNEIIAGIADNNNYVWTFEPIKIFHNIPNVDTYIISITEQCNLRCTYCCYSGDYKNNRKHNHLMMSTNDIDEVFAYIVEHYNGDSLKLAFYGGEPLTSFAFLKYAIIKARSIWSKCVDISISTNGVLLTTDKIDWFVENNVRLDISIDGGKRIHNRHRVDTKGNGTFEQVKRAIRYIKDNYPEYLKENVQLLMTIVSLLYLEQAAEEWHNDSVLRDLVPTKISSLAINFAEEVLCLKYEELVERYVLLLDLYEIHQDWLVLKVFFEQCIAYWITRPIMSTDEVIPMSTCLPITNKLFIDCKKRLNVCEKFCDKYPIGSIREGVNWDAANSLTREYYNKRKKRCVMCPAIRMCNMCLTAVEYNVQEWDILCNNERTFAQIGFRIFCEMAERGLIEQA